MPDRYAVVTEVVEARGLAAIVSEKDGTLVVAAPLGEKINGIRYLADRERALSIVEQRDLPVRWTCRRPLNAASLYGAVVDDGAGISAAS